MFRLLAVAAVVGVICFVAGVFLGARLKTAPKDPEGDLKIDPAGWGPSSSINRERQQKENLALKDTVDRITEKSKGT